MNLFFHFLCASGTCRISTVEKWSLQLLHLHPTETRLCSSSKFSAKDIIFIFLDLEIQQIGNTLCIFLEKMDKVCDGCSNWAEDIYWTHFQFTHFYQILAGGCEQQLVIPKKFSNNLKKKLPSTVALKGPSGAKWDVGLTTTDDTLYFKHGWQEFVKAHSLEQNDLLIFRYNGGSQFDVLIFDWQSFCEKEASYFVKMCEQKTNDTKGGKQAKRKLREPSLDEFDANTTDGVECASSENIIHDDSMERMIQDVVSKATNIKGPPEVCSAEPLRAMPMRTRRRKDTPTNAGKVTKKDTPTNARKLPKEDTPTNAGILTPVPDYDVGAASITKVGSYAEQYVSNRRAVTEYEKENALKLAEAASSDAGFKIIMRPSHVYRRFFLFIPTGWVTANISLENQDLILRVGNDDWPAKFNYNRSRQCGGLSSGWKHFAIDNNLEEFDVCVFEPIPRANGPKVLEVKIFRVVDDVVPVTRVSSSAAKSSRKLIKGT